MVAWSGFADQYEGIPVSNAAFLEPFECTTTPYVITSNRLAWNVIHSSGP